MTNRLKRVILPVLTLMLLVYGCTDPVSKKTDAQLETKLPVTVAPNSGGEGGLITTQAILIPSGDDELAGQGKPEKFEISGIRGRVSELAGDIELSDIRIELSAGQAGNVTWNFKRLPVYNGMVLPLDDTGGQWAQTETLLAAADTVRIRMDATANRIAAPFNFTVLIDARVTLR